MYHFPLIYSFTLHYFRSVAKKEKPKVEVKINEEVKMD